MLAILLLASRFILLSQVPGSFKSASKPQGSFDESKSGVAQSIRTSGIRGSIDAGGYAASSNAKTQSELYLQLVDLQVSCLRRAWQPDNPCIGGNTLRREAVRHLATAEYSLAARQLEGLPHSINDELGTHELLGLAYEGTGQLQDAVEQFRRVAEKTHSVSSSYVYAVALLLTGETAKAQTELQRYPTQGESDLRLLHLGLGSVAFESGDLPQSLHLLLKAAEQDATGTAAFGLIAVAVNSLSPATLPATVEQLQALADRFSRNGSAHYALASALKQADTVLTTSSHSAVIESELKQAVELNPSLTGAHAQLAAVYAERQELGLAVAEFRTALEQDARLVELHYRLGKLYNRLGESELSKTELDLHRSLRERQIAEFKDGKVPVQVPQLDSKACR